MDVLRNRSLPLHSQCCVSHSSNVKCDIPSPFTTVSFYGHLHYVGEKRPQIGEGDCTVSMKYKFAFPHILKSGGSALKNWFIAVLCEGERKKKGDNYPNADSACLREVSMETSCFFLPQDDLFTFAFVRNPIDRAISQVKSLCLLLLKKSCVHICGSYFLFVIETILFPFLLIQYAMATSNVFIQRNPPSFEQFMNEGPVIMTPTVSRLAKSHYASQSSFIFDTFGCPTVDFIGRLETFDRDMMYILEQLNAPELWNGYKKYCFRGHVGNDPNVFGTKYKNSHSIELTEEMRRNFYMRSFVDFAMFGYSMELPPKDKQLAFEEYMRTSSEVSPTKGRKQLISKRLLVSPEYSFLYNSPLKKVSATILHSRSRRIR